jgi:hypothetical protein
MTGFDLRSAFCGDLYALFRFCRDERLAVQWCIIVDVIVGAGLLRIWNADGLI